VHGDRGVMGTICAVMVLIMWGGLGGDGYAQAKAAPITVVAEELVVKQLTGEATFRGKVRVEQGEMVLQAAQVKILYGQGSTAGRGVQQLEARGGVVVTRGGGSDEEARGEVASYDPARRSLTMTGPEVVLQRGPSRLVGDRLVYNLDNQQATMTRQGGPVRATFVTAP
jgi:lipopolysaccharide export system protein LptA